MNKRIKELAEQAGFITDNNKISALTQDITIDFEKFVELIVRECVGIIDVEIQQQEQVALSNNRDSTWVNGKIEHFNELKMKTKEHFGVKQ